MQRMALRRIIASKALSRSSRSYHACRLLGSDALDMCDSFSRRHCELQRFSAHMCQTLNSRLEI